MINPEADRVVWSAFCRRSLPGVLLMSAAVLLSTSCATKNPGVTTAQTEQKAGNPSESSLVECVIPPQVRRLSGRVVNLSPTQRVRISAKECEERGGDFEHAERADRKP